MIICYSTTRVPAALRPEGARYLNPSFFTGCEPGASLVYLNGDFRKVRAAYERAGVSVVDLRARAAPVAPLAAPKGKFDPARDINGIAEMMKPSAGVPGDIASFWRDVDAADGKVGDLNLAPADALLALADLPEAEQAEVEAVLNDDTPFDGLTDEPDAS